MASWLTVIPVLPMLKRRDTPTFYLNACAFSRKGLANSSRPSVRREFERDGPLLDTNNFVTRRAAQLSSTPWGAWRRACEREVRFEPAVYARGTADRGVLN